MSMNLVIPVRENTELRSIQLQDAQTFFDVAHNNNTHLRQWLSWADNDKTVTDTEDYIRESVERFTKKEGLDFGIWYTNQLVGGIGIDPWNTVHKKISLAYWLSEEFQGQGIMHDSLKTVITYAFTEMAIHRIEICCAVGHTKSSALPKKLGFSYEGISRDSEWLYDHFVDMEVYSLLSTEWKM